MPVHELAFHLVTLATLRLLTLNPGNRFSHVRAVPLQTLSQLTERYLSLLAITAKQHAELAGRTQPNAADVVQAMEDFGQRLDEVWEWCEQRRLGGDGLQMAASGGVAPSALGALLKDTSRTSQNLQSASVIQYAPLSQTEEEQLRTVRIELAKPFVPGVRPLSPSTPDSSPEVETPEDQLTLSLPTIKTAQDDESYTNDHYKPPSDILAFLPPLPDLAANDASKDAQTVVIEDEVTGASRTVKRARRNIDKATGAAFGVWHRQVAYEGSQLAEYETRPLPELSQEIMLANLLEDVNGSDTTAISSSLPHFLETYNYISLESDGQDTLPLRYNPKRRRAATAIQSNILINPSDDSLSGAVPTPQPRLAKKQAGWIPYPPLSDRDDPNEPSGRALIPFPALHAFTTSLPVTLSETAPSLILPHATATVVPSMHPRYPTAHASIRTLLSASSPGLFMRTTRIGPPGPLTDTGATRNYEVELEKPNILGAPFAASTRMMSWGFDWEIHNENEDVVPALQKAAAQQQAATASGNTASAAPTPSATAPVSVSTPVPLVSSGNPRPNASYKGPAFPQLPQRWANGSLSQSQQRGESVEVFAAPSPVKPSLANSTSRSMSAAPTPAGGPPSPQRSLSIKIKQNGSTFTVGTPAYTPAASVPASALPFHAPIAEEMHTGDDASSVHNTNLDRDQAAVEGIFAGSNGAGAFTFEELGSGLGGNEDYFSEVNDRVNGGVHDKPLDTSSGTVAIESQQPKHSFADSMDFEEF